MLLKNIPEKYTKEVPKNIPKNILKNIPKSIPKKYIYKGGGAKDEAKFEVLL